MMNLPANIVAQQDGAGELIVWIVIGVIWAVAQLVTRAREKNRPHAPPPPPQRRTAQNLDLEEFFEQLQKQHDEAMAPRPVKMTAEPRTAPPPPPKPQATPRPVAYTAPSRPRPKPQPIRVPIPQAVQKPTPQPTRKRRERIDFPPIQEVGQAAPLSIADSYPVEGTTRILRSGMPAVRSGFELKDTAMKGLRLLPDSPRLASQDIRKMFHGREAMRRSLISRFVLGPPRAQQPWAYPEA